MSFDINVNMILMWIRYDAERFHMKLMGSVKKSNVEFYELINILGDIATNTITNSKMFAQGLIVSYRKKKQ